MFAFRMMTLTLSLVLMSASALAQQNPFSTGPVIEAFGQNAPVDATIPVSRDMVYRVSFDIGEGAAPGQISRDLNTPARFINMMARAGVPLENIQVAVVIHGSAVVDVTRDSVYEARNQTSNANRPLVEALLKAGAHFYVCGQSAAGQRVMTQDLLPGVDMVLSAITAHAILGNEGYRPNPF